MFRLAIFVVIMLCWVPALSGCAAIEKGPDIEGGDFRRGYPPRGGYSRTDRHKAQVTEACNIEANDLVSDEDFRADDRARRVYFSQCMLRNGYDTAGNYIGIPPE